jgi:peroxiredoxin
MSRFALALAFTLMAVTANAQTDPRTNTGSQPPVPTSPRSGGLGLTRRAVAQVLVGERAPDFELPTATGAPFRQRDARGRWVALFFTDRREELPRIAGLAHTLDSLDVRTLAVCPEKVQALHAWSDTEKTKAPMLVLADERGDISALYGLWDTPRSATRQGLLLLDPQGVVRVALLGQKVSAPSLPGLVQSAMEGL